MQGCVVADVTDLFQLGQFEAGLSRSMADVFAAGDVLCPRSCCSCSCFGNCRRESRFKRGGPDLKTV